MIDSSYAPAPFGYTEISSDEDSGTLLVFSQDRDGWVDFCLIPMPGRVCKTCSSDLGRSDVSAVSGLCLMCLCGPL